MNCQIKQHSFILRMLWVSVVTLFFILLEAATLELLASVGIPIFPLLPASLARESMGPTVSCVPGTLEE